MIDNDIPRTIMFKGVVYLRQDASIETEAAIEATRRCSRTSALNQRLLESLNLNKEEFRRLIVGFKLGLSIIDCDYRINLSQLSEENDMSRPTAYICGEKCIKASVWSLRSIRQGRPPKKTKKEQSV